MASMLRIPVKFPKTKLLKIVLSCLFCMLMILSAHAGEKVSGCHCFRNRTFDPAKKFAADEYLLTTTANSLTSGHFNISKRQIVMMKMQGGVSNTDLLIGLHIAAISGSDVSDVIETKGEKKWKDTLATHPELSRETDPDELTKQLHNGLPAGHAAAKILAGILTKRFGATPDQLQNFESTGLTTPETILILTLADHSGAKPEDILSLHKEGRSWSEIAHNFGLAPVEVGKLLLAPTKQ